MWAEAGSKANSGPALVTTLGQEAFRPLEVGQHRDAQADRDEPQHVGRVAADFLDDARMKPRVGARAEKLAVRLGPGFARAEHKAFVAQVGEVEGEASGKGMALGQHDFEGHAPDSEVFEALKRRRQRQKGQVDAALAQGF